MAPTNCALPLSPIFIKVPGLAQDGSEKVELFNNTTSALLDNLDEIVSLPQEFLNLGKFFRPCLSFVDQSEHSITHCVSVLTNQNTVLRVN